MRLLGAVSCFGAICSKVWHGFRFAESKKGGQGADQLRADNSVRIARAERFFDNPKSRAYRIVFFVCMPHTESLVDFFKFYLNTDAQDPERPPDADMHAREHSSQCQTRNKAMQ